MPNCIGVDGGPCQYADFTVAYNAATSAIYIAGADAAGMPVEISVNLVDGLPITGTILNSLGIDVLGARPNDCTVEAGNADPHPILRANGGRILNIFKNVVPYGLELRFAHLDLLGGEALGRNGGSVHIDKFIDGNSRYTFEDVLISGGHTDQDGGCVYANQLGILTFEDSTIENCSADGDGGGIYTVGPSRELTLHNTLIRNSTATIKGGGVVVDNAHLTMSGTSVIEDCTSGNGGGLWIAGAWLANLAVEVELIDDAVIRSNHATANGGGVYVTGNDEPLPPQPVLSVKDRAQISDNSADLDGGGIYSIAAHVTVDDGLLDGNVASGDGGGVFATIDANEAFGSQLELKGSATISGSDAQRGGGIFLEGSELSMWDDSTVHACTAVDGGGLYVNQLIASPRTHVDLHGSSSLTNNVASGDGGGAYVDGEIESDASGAILNDPISLYARDQSQVAFNRAVNGGGVYLEGAQLLAADSSQLYGNAAENNGGGVAATSDLVQLQGPPIVDVERRSEVHVRGASWSHLLIPYQEPHPTGGMQILSNVANTADAGGAGGGIYADRSDVGPDFRNVVIEFNTAGGGTGGGIALRNDSRLLAENVVFYGNSAALGGGLHTVGSKASALSIFNSPNLSCNPPVDFLNQPNRYCTEFHSNVGGAIYAEDSWLILALVSLRFNDGTGSSLGGALDLRNGTQAIVRGSLFSKNQDEADTVSVDDSSYHSRFNTYAEENSLAVHYLANADGSFRGNVVWDPVNSPLAPGFDLLQLDGGPVPGSCNVGDGIDNADFIGVPNNVNGDPIYTTDSRGSDYHLQALSPAVDACSLDGIFDLDGNPRPVLNVDAGAFEGAYP